MKYGKLQNSSILVRGSRDKSCTNDKVPATTDMAMSLECRQGNWYTLIE